MFLTQKFDKEVDGWISCKCSKISIIFGQIYYIKKVIQTNVEATQVGWPSSRENTTKLTETTDQVISRIEQIHRKMEVGCLSHLTDSTNCSPLQGNHLSHCWPIQGNPAMGPHAGGEGSRNTTGISGENITERQHFNDISFTSTWGPGACAYVFALITEIEDIVVHSVER